MKLLYDRKSEERPALSFVLLDWSVRESFHILHYLNNQSAPRGSYQVVLIEFYERRAGEIEEAMARAEAVGSPPPVDTWAVMEMPRSIYYHKHLMYNVGIALSRGRIVCLMDSDAIVRPTFVESIVRAFEEDSNIVLHLDQMRNFNRKFYPFDYPSVEQIEKEGPTNALGGRPEGLSNSLDPLRTRNYGACMCALREDLIAIGGADEHIDYLGHVCGPYEMTFRLVNAGKREVWHQSEFLYHTWHPGQAGGGNYVGPSDGRNVSTTALDVRRTGRVMPLRENPAIRALRSGQAPPESELLGLSVSAVDVNEWDSGRLDKGFAPEGGSPVNVGYVLGHPLLYLRLLFPVLRILAGHLRGNRAVLGAEGPGRMPSALNRVLHQALNYGGYVIHRSRQCLSALGKEGVREIAVYGAGPEAQIFEAISGEFLIRISARYGDVESLRGYRGRLVVAENVKAGGGTVRRLKEAGVRAENMVLLI